ncbi:MAG TPA: CDP-alcohol phosphatidyltransferase family protein [Thermoanaerobaculia bacterium]|nr:CDP-alcohol phosphatidyltransferase family protein [Thermoanaerobaculia bacterium]
MNNRAISGRRSRVLTVPNALTLVRILVIPFFLIASMRSAFTLALILFLFAGVTDVIDGYIARRFDQRSKLGAVLDPAADKTMMIAGYILFTFHEAVRFRLPVWLTFTVFARDVLIVFVAYLLYTRVRVTRFPPSVAGKVSTLLQIVALSATIAVNGTPIEPAVRPLVGPVCRLALLATLYSGFDYLRRARMALGA